jgi:hypothetical protein
VDVDEAHQQIDKTVLVESVVVVGLREVAAVVAVAALAPESLIVAFLSHSHSQGF